MHDTRVVDCLESLQEVLADLHGMLEREPS